MDSSSIELPGSEISEISFQDGVLRVSFARAIIIKTMTGSVEKTRWWQAGDLIIEEAEIESTVPSGPLVCAGGDVYANVYTYRDMIPIPLENRGKVGCKLAFKDIDVALVVSGERIRLDMRAVPKYIEHIRPE